VIIESPLPGNGRSIDLSQGSHFFHNISNLGVLYFSLSSGEKFPIDWQWINEQEIIQQGNYSRHVRLSSPLNVRVDGRKRKGVIYK
jgi:hypothetical protein